MVMVKMPKRTPVVMPTVEQDRLINAAAQSDPDAAPLTPRQLREMVPLRSLRPRAPNLDAPVGEQDDVIDVAVPAVNSKP